MNVVETAQSLNPSINPSIKVNKAHTKLTNNTTNQNTQTHIGENSTTISNLAFLNKLSLDPTPENLNKINKNTVSTPTKIESDNSQFAKNKTFAGRTKEWVGNVWNSIKTFQFRKLFKKNEYKIFRNSNGDLVKIPVKKIPLKKKQQNAITGKRIKISQEQNGIVSNYLL